MNKVQRENLFQIYSRGGVVLVSEWTNGSGRFVTKKAIPPLCERVERRDAHKFSKRISSVFDERPKVQAVIAIMDMEEAKKQFTETTNQENN